MSAKSYLRENSSLQRVVGDGEAASVPIDNASRVGELRDVLHAPKLAKHVFSLKHFI